MPVLANPQHERFAQELHRRLWAGEKQASARLAAYRFAGFAVPETPAAGRPRKGRRRPDPGANARRLANHKAVRARLDELAERAAQLAGLDAGWAMLRLMGFVESNVDDYLAPPDAEGRRYFAVDAVSREKLGLLAELHQDEETIDGKDGPIGRVRKVKIKLPDRIAAIGLMAKIAGWYAPARMEATGKDGGPIETRELSGMSAPELARRISHVIERAATAAAKQPEAEPA